MVKARNKSEDPQHFVGIGTFQPKEALPVTQEQADILRRSPHMEIIEETQKGRLFKAVDKSHTVKGVEAE